MEKNPTINTINNTANANTTKANKVKSTNSQNVAYIGEVTVTKRCGNRILTKQNYHNEGSSILFNFIATCLKGDFSNKTNGLPARILLVYNEAPLSQAKPWSTSTRSVSQKISFYEPPTLKLAQENTESGDINTDSSSVTYHFLVPYSTISSSENTVKYNQINLYSEGGDEEHPLAAFYLVKESDNTQWDEHTIELSNARKGYNLLVDWKLEIGNIKSTTTV